MCKEEYFVTELIISGRNPPFYENESMSLKVTLSMEGFKKYVL
jgi:hypothetical protein